MGWKSTTAPRLEAQADHCFFENDAGVREIVPAQEKSSTRSRASSPWFAISRISSTGFLSGPTLTPTRAAARCVGLSQTAAASESPRSGLCSGLSVQASIRCCPRMTMSGGGTRPVRVAGSAGGPTHATAKLPSPDLDFLCAASWAVDPAGSSGTSWEYGSCRTLKYSDPEKGSGGAGSNPPALLGNEKRPVEPCTH